MKIYNKLVLTLLITKISCCFNLSAAFKNKLRNRKKLYKITNNLSNLTYSNDLTKQSRNYLLNKFRIPINESNQMYEEDCISIISTEEIKATIRELNPENASTIFDIIENNRGELSLTNLKITDEQLDLLFYLVPNPLDIWLINLARNLLKTANGIEKFKNVSMLTLSNNPIQSINNILELKQLQYLDIKNMITNIEEASRLRLLPNLNHLIITLILERSDIDLFKSELEDI